MVCVFNLPSILLVGKGERARRWREAAEADRNRCNAWRSGGGDIWYVPSCSK
jgi:hypothetical protein